MKAQQTLLIAGSGFLSAAVARWFHRDGWRVQVLTRRPAAVERPAVPVSWDGRTRGDWETALREADVLINFCGQSVNCRYHAANRRAILESRVQPTRLLGEALADCPTPPRVWLNAASATIYRHAEDRGMSEAEGELGAGFSVDVCRAWEEEARRWRRAETRQVLLRTSMVLGHGANSVYPVLARLARLGLAGTMGHGSQFISWIHQEDFCRVVAFLVSGDLEGPVNVTAPEPVTNRFFMQALRTSLGRQLGLPATRWMLECGAVFLRTETELVLKSRRIIPRRLRNAGFTWRFSTAPSALEDLAKRQKCLCHIAADLGARGMRKHGSPGEYLAQNLSRSGLQTVR